MSQSTDLLILIGISMMPTARSIGALNLQVRAMSIIRSIGMPGSLFSEEHTISPRMRSISIHGRKCIRIGFRISLVRPISLHMETGHGTIFRLRPESAVSLNFSSISRALLTLPVSGSPLSLWSSIRQSFSVRIILITARQATSDLPSRPLRQRLLSCSLSLKSLKHGSESRATILQSRSMIPSTMTAFILSLHWAISLE